MQELSTIRNISIIAHIDAGKTTTTEGMLFFSGTTHRFGNIDQGTTAMDYLPEERSRGITITAAAASLEWSGHLLHLIDTPGHIDFTAEVERSLRVIDGAVVVFSAVEGVEAQSEKVWRQADHYQVPKLAFVNKLDRVGASFERVLGEINAHFGDCAVPLQMPVGREDDFTAVVDLVSLEYLQFSGTDNDTVARLPVPEELREQAAQEREALIERLADESDEIAAHYLDGADVPVDTMRQTVRRLTMGNVIVPVLAGSAKKRLGIQPVLDAIIAYLPSPQDIQDLPTHGVRSHEPRILHPDSTAPFAGLVFKVVADPGADLLYLRTYSGTLRANATLANSRTGDKVRAKQILRLFAKNTQAVEQVGPGDIVGVIGPRDCGTGDTLCDPRHLTAFEKITFPDPVLSMAVEPRFSRDKEKLDNALTLLCREDPTLSRSLDEDTGQRVLAGMGELHLEINLKRLQTDFRVEVRMGEPRVAYRERLRTATTEHAVFAKTLGETELYAAVRVRFTPIKRGEQAFRIENRLRNEKQLPRALVAAADRGLTDGLQTGGNHGYPLIYLAAELLELQTQPDRTTEGAVVGAVLMAVDQAIRQSGTRVLEPLMHLEILAPAETVGEVTLYLQPRRALIHSMATVGDYKRVSCEVPLAEMFGFSKALPRLTGGRATFSMEPCGYQDVPADVARKLFGGV